MYVAAALHAEDRTKAQSSLQLFKIVSQNLGKAAYTALFFGSRELMTEGYEFAAVVGVPLLVLTVAYPRTLPAPPSANFAADWPAWAARNAAAIEVTGLANDRARREVAQRSASPNALARVASQGELGFVYEPPPTLSEEISVELTELLRLRTEIAGARMCRNMMRAVVGRLVERRRVQGAELRRMGVPARGAAGAVDSAAA